MMKKRMILPALVLLLSAACHNGRYKVTEETKTHKDSNVQVLETDQTEKAVENANKSNAGFRNEVEKEVTVTVPCFGACDSTVLDMLPAPGEATRRDSSIIRRLNAGEIFLLQAGEKGIRELETGSKLFVRFCIGEVWVWKSSVE